VEVDHIVPLSEGGAPYDRENLRGVCRPCHHQGIGPRATHRNVANGPLAAQNRKTGPHIQRATPAVPGV
jgi:5-methylcytosine-specific restriction endonuclease McrA